MADLALLTHNLRFYVADTQQPYVYHPEELALYLTAAGRRLGLEDEYPTWADMPSYFDSLIVKIGYYNFLLKQANATTASSDIRIEDLEIGSSAGDSILKLLKILKDEIAEEEAHLGVGQATLSVADVPRFDPYTRTKVPYETSQEPPVPVLTHASASITPSSVDLSWTRYSEQDFQLYRLEDSVDSGVTWTPILIERDNHSNSYSATGLAAGAHLFRVSTVLNNDLESTSSELLVTLA